jgi:hypothetical protein
LNKKIINIIQYIITQYLVSNIVYIHCLNINPEYNNVQSWIASEKTAENKDINSFKQIYELNPDLFKTHIERTIMWFTWNLMSLVEDEYNNNNNNYNKYQNYFQD